MLRLGAVLALFGFGSAALHFTDIQFRLLMWAEEWQPALGLIVGAVGAVFLLVGVMRSNDDPAQPQQGAPGPAAPQAAYGQQPGYPPPPGPGYGPPQGGYPPGQPPIPQQGPQYGTRPPQGPPPPRGPVQDFGPPGGPPFGPQGR